MSCCNAVLERNCPFLDQFPPVTRGFGGDRWWNAKAPTGLASDEDFLWTLRDDVLEQIAEPRDTVLWIKTWNSISRTTTELRL